MSLSHPAVAVDRKWRVYIDDIEYTYSSIDFEKTHPSDYPDTFTIVLNGQHVINSFAVVEIEKDGVLIFYGYVEKRKWTSDVDTIVSGRCRKLVAWKKWTERFEETRGKMQGFFGVVLPEELFKFILRCPVSDVPSDDESWGDYPRQKIGWGINPTKWTCNSNSSSNGTDPIYTKLRLLDFYWRNRGMDSTLIGLVPNSCNGAMQWSDTGGLANCWDYVATCGDTEYIHEITNGEASYGYGFPNLAGTATGITNTKLYLSLRRGIGWFGWGVTVQVQVYDGTDWHIVGYATIFSYVGWNDWTLDITHVLDTVAKVNGAQVKLVKYSGPPAQIMCDCMQLRVDYSENGSQNIGDYFEVALGENRSRVCGIIVQSRHSSDQYPRNYCIQAYEEGYGDVDFTTWTEVDVGADHITVAATHIDHDQYKDEDTYVYEDFGAGEITNFEHTFRFRTINALVVDPDDLGPIYIPYMSSLALNDAYWQTLNGDAIIFGAWYRTSAPTGPMFFLSAYNNPAGVTNFDGVFATNTWYWVRIIKNGRTVTAWVYTSEADFLADTNRHADLTSTIPTADITMRYMYAGVTYNTGTAYNCDGDIEIFNLGDWENLVCETNNTCAQDIIHSWQPRAIERIRIVIMGADATHAWEISQIFIYEADEYKYCVVEET